MCFPADVGMYTPSEVEIADVESYESGELASLVFTTNVVVCLTFRFSYCFFVIPIGKC